MGSLNNSMQRGAVIVNQIPATVRIIASFAVCSSAAFSGSAPDGCDRNSATRDELDFC